MFVDKFGFFTENRVGVLIRCRPPADLVGDKQIIPCPEPQAANGREITWFQVGQNCDVNCDVQAQSGSTKSNKISGDVFSFRAGGSSCLAYGFSGLGAHSPIIPEKLIIPWLGFESLRANQNKLLTSVIIEDLGSSWAIVLGGGAAAYTGAEFAHFI